MGEMINFQDFVTAHLQWRARLAEQKNRDDFDIETIRRDDLCEIGKWFHGPGREQYGEVSEFTCAKDAHAGFHSAVAHSLETTGCSGGDPEFEVLVKSLKALSDKIFTQADGNGNETHEIDEECLNAFKMAAMHLDNRSIELAQTVLKRLPCDECGLGGDCDGIAELFDKIRESSEQD